MSRHSPYDDDDDSDDDDMPFDDRDDPHASLYREMEMMGVSRQLTTKAISLCNGSIDRARDVLQEFDDLKQYLTRIGFSQQNDDVLLEYSHKRRGATRPLHPLSALTADMDWFSTSPMYSTLVDRSKSLCSQETIINAVCGENPVCYETIMGFQSTGNSSYTQRLSRRLLRFMCNRVNTEIENHLSQTSRFMLQNLTGQWSQFAMRHLKSVTFWMVVTPARSIPEQTATIDACIEGIRDLETPRMSLARGCEACTAQVFHTFVMTRIARLMIENRGEIERAFVHRGADHPPRIQWRFNR